MRWKRHAAVAMTVLSLSATASRAQSTTFMSSNFDWTTLLGCHISPAPLWLPGGIVYYSPNTFPAAGPWMLGICGPIPEHVPPPTFGGGPTGFPDFGTGGGGGDGGSIDQFFTPPTDQGNNGNGDNNQGDNNQGDNNQGDNNQGDNNQGDNNQGDDDQGNSNGGPHYALTNDDPPNNLDIPQNNAALDTTTTPEPSTVILLGLGLAGLGVREVQRRKLFIGKL